MTESTKREIAARRNWARITARRAARQALDAARNLQKVHDLLVANGEAADFGRIEMALRAAETLTALADDTTSG